MARVIIMMADYGHDPTETAVPYAAFKAAGFDVTFAMESGKSPACDARMLTGPTQLFLGASRAAINQYNTMTASPEWKAPQSWTAPSFHLAAYDLVFLPGGHDKPVRQLIDSPAVHTHLLTYFPQTRKPARKATAAVCHGVLALSETRRADGVSVLRGCTTTLPARFEQLAFWGTRAMLGDYYKTYGAGSPNTEDMVRKAVADPSHLKISLLPFPFVVQDANYNYISARFPGDAHLLSEKVVSLVKQLTESPSSTKYPAALHPRAVTSTPRHMISPTPAPPDDTPQTPQIPPS